MRKIFLAAALACASGCAATLGPAGAPAWPPDWTSERAEHLVSIAIDTASGNAMRRGPAFYGLIEVTRPGRVRLRAFSYGVHTPFFEFVDDRGWLDVVYAAPSFGRTAFGAPTPELLALIAGDLSAAYGLDPAPPDRVIERSDEEVTVRETSRVVRLSRFQIVQGHSIPTQVDIDHPETLFRYRLRVRLASAAITG
jgi:hypothetical protein